MVGEIKRAFEENLKYVRWMDAETKRAAKEKVGDGCLVLRQARKKTGLLPGAKTDLLQLSFNAFNAGGRHLQHGGLPRLHYERHQPGQTVQ